MMVIEFKNHRLVRKLPGLSPYNSRCYIVALDEPLAACMALHKQAGLHSSETALAFKMSVVCGHVTQRLDHGRPNHESSIVIADVFNRKLLLARPCRIKCV